MNRSKTARRLRIFCCIALLTASLACISVAAGADSIVPTFRATVTAVPNVSALFPLVGLIAAVSFTQILRRRRAAQKTASIV